MADDTIWIESTRDPDGEPVCALTWGTLAWYAPVAEVRQTAVDLVTCAAYAEMMHEMVAVAGLPPEVVGAFTTSLLRGAGRTRAFGSADTIDVIPAGAKNGKTGERQAVVVLARASEEGMVTAAEARVMAWAWLAVAEATESDQLVAEAFRATLPGKEGALDRLFGYLRKLRERAAQ